MTGNVIGEMPTMFAGEEESEWEDVERLRWLTHILQVCMDKIPLRNKNQENIATLRIKSYGK